MLFAIEKVVEDTALTGQHFPWFSVILWATTIILVVLGGIKMRKRVVKVVVKVLRKAPKKSTGWTALSNQALSEFYNFAGKFNGLYSRLFQAVEGHQIYEVRKSLLAWGERLQTIRAAYYREWYLRNMDDIGLLTNDEVYSRAVLFCKEMQKIGLVSDAGPYASKDDPKFDEKFIIQDEEFISCQRYRVVDYAWLLQGEVVERGTVTAKKTKEKSND